MLTLYVSRSLSIFFGGRVFSLDFELLQGLGAFATRAIRAHELVAEYTGERLNLEEAQNRTAKYRETNVMVRGYCDSNRLL